MEKNKQISSLNTTLIVEAALIGHVRSWYWWVLAGTGRELGGTGEEVMLVGGGKPESTMM
jgi:hypothetical protein